MANKQPEVTAQTKRNLQEAFWSLYVEKPLTKISIKEITDRAGYNRGTFYLYYKDVYDILGRIEQELLEKIGALIEERLIKEGRLDIEGNMEIILGLTRECDPDRMAKLLGDSGDPQFRARFKELIWPLVRTYLIPQDNFSPAERRFVKELHLSGLLAAITAWLEDDGGIPLDDFIRLVMSQLAPTRARK